MRRAPAIAVAALFAAASAAAAQDTTLARIDSLTAAGRLTEARSTLAHWRDRNPTGARGVDPADLAHALYLEGRLATDAAVAVDSYLAVALGYPTAHVAPGALLRLGQALLASGDAARAAAYLERLANDYPTAPERAPGLLWLARAHNAAGRPDRACKTARSGLDVRTANADVHALLRVEEDAACQPPPAIAPATPAVAPATPTATPATARFAAQAGAFRDHDAARALAQRLARAGFDTRVAFFEGSALARVRIGAFTRQADAQAQADRLRERGIDAIVVDDVQRERVR